MVCLSFRFAIPGFIRDTEELREVFGEPDRKIQVPVNVREVDHSRRFHPGCAYGEHTLCELLSIEWNPYDVRVASLELKCGVCGQLIGIVGATLHSYTEHSCTAVVLHNGCDGRARHTPFIFGEGFRDGMQKWWRSKP